jgi:hypothetical protein
MKSVKSTLVFSILSMTVLAIPAPIASQSVHNHSKHHHYKVIDIGTFGGPESYIIPVQGVGSPNPVSSRGRAVGTAGTTTALDDYHNIICGGLEGGVPWVNQAFLAWNHSLINLGALGGDSSCSNGTSINTAGEIAGSSENGDIDPVLGLYELRAVRWRKRQIEDLKTLGGNHSMAGSINNHGQIAGFALNQTSDSYSMFEFQIFGISNGTQTRAALWDKDNNIQDLGTLGTGNDAWADFVNDRGQVAGFSYTTSTADPGTGVPPTHPFL